MFEFSRQIQHLSKNTKCNIDNIDHFGGEKNQEHFWLWIFKRKLTFRKTYKINSWPFLARKFKKKVLSKNTFFAFLGRFSSAIKLYYCLPLPSILWVYCSRMGRKIEKRPHDGGGSVTCSIMAWFPLFSLTLLTDGHALVVMVSFRS